jgi:hypothetical protein
MASSIWYSWFELSATYLECLDLRDKEWIEVKDSLLVLEWAWNGSEYNGKECI